MADEAKTAERGVSKAAWGAPFDRLDRAWTRLEARLAAAVLIAEVGTLVFWISIKALSASGRGGSGLMFRSLVMALVFGVVARIVTGKAGMTRAPHREIATTVAALAGFLLGRALGGVGHDYFANILGWMQNASILVFFGGVSEVAKRLTMWLALLGASMATAQGKHINVDVVMRFLSPRARVPVAALGWVTAAVVSGAAAWGFFDHVAVNGYQAPAAMPCPSDPKKECPGPAGEKIGIVTRAMRKDLFLAGRQASLDLRSLPRVLTGAPYGTWLTARAWNAWLRDGGWEAHFAPDAVKALELPDDGDASAGAPAYRTPAVTTVPGASVQVQGLLSREANLVVPFGLFVIALRFLLRTLLAVSGWIKVDPESAHGEEGLHPHVLPDITYDNERREGGAS